VRSAHSSKCCRRAAEQRDQQDRDEGAVGAEAVGVGDDQIAEACDSREDLRDDHADQRASDGQPQTGDNIRQRRRQDQVAPPPALSGAAGLRHLDQVAAGSTSTGARLASRLVWAYRPVRLGNVVPLRGIELIGELA
jgi:hypothetical protein